MIQPKFKRLITAGVITAAIAAGMPSCVDDHFDVQDGGGVGENATLTLWQQLKANPELSNFASIVEKTPAFKDEKHQIQGYTFKDVLSGTQVLTVFAPTNSAFTDADVRTYDSLLQVRPYDVYLRLVGNHIARNRFVATGTNPSGTAEELIMVNNKKATFDRSGKLFKEIPLLQANVPATNGILHTIGEVSPFAYNIYEYIRAYDFNYRNLNAWIEQHDTLYFNSNASAEAGANPETGEPIYVDSVYTRFNSLYWYSYEPASVDWPMPHKGIGANLESEDSIWAVVLPSDAAWAEVKARINPDEDHENKSWYNYADTYFDKEKEDALVKDDGAAKRAMTLTVTDSLSDVAFNMDMVSPLAFNVRLQKRTAEQADFWTVDDFLSKKITKLTNTRSDTFMIDSAATIDAKPLIFDQKQPVAVSNGIIFPVDHWNFLDSWGYKDVEIKASAISLFQNVRYNLTTQEQKERTYNADFTTYSFNSATSKLVTDSLLGAVSKNTFMTFWKSTGTPTAEFALRDRENNHQIYSNLNYDIYLVMVPDFYRWDPDSIIAITEGEPAAKKTHMQVQVTYLVESARETKTAANAMRFDYDGERVDTIYAGTIKFPYSYRNLTDAYPTITVSSIAPKTSERGIYQTTFSIDRIILRAREE